MSTSAPNTKRTPASRVGAERRHHARSCRRRRRAPTGVASSSTPSPSWSARPQATARQGTRRRSSESAQASASITSSPSAETTRSPASLTRRSPSRQRSEQRARGGLGIRRARHGGDHGEARGAGRAHARGVRGVDAADRDHRQRAHAARHRLGERASPRAPVRRRPSSACRRPARRRRSRSARRRAARACSSVCVERPTQQARARLRPESAPAADRPGRGGRRRRRRRARGRSGRSRRRARRRARVSARISARPARAPRGRARAWRAAARPRRRAAQAARACATGERGQRGSSSASTWSPPRRCADGRRVNAAPAAGCRARRSSCAACCG